MGDLELLYKLDEMTAVPSGFAQATRSALRQPWLFSEAGSCFMVSEGDLVAHKIKSAGARFARLCTSIWKSALPSPLMSPETIAMSVLALYLTCSSPALW